jgi:hypothetical protein
VYITLHNYRHYCIVHDVPAAAAAAIVTILLVPGAVPHVQYGVTVIY